MNNALERRGYVFTHCPALTIQATSGVGHASSTNVESVRNSSGPSRTTAMCGR